MWDSWRASTKGRLPKHPDSDELGTSGVIVVLVAVSEGEREIETQLLLPRALVPTRSSRHSVSQSSLRKI